MKNISFVTGPSVALALLAGCSGLEKRVAALEGVTEVHTRQLAGTFVTAVETGSVTLPQNDFLVLASLDLPEGNYVVSGQIVGRSADSKPKDEGLGCDMRVTASDGKVTQFGGFGNILTRTFEINPLGTIALPVAGVASIRCRTDKADTIFIQWTKLVVAGVPRLVEGSSASSSKP
jgi:hypothetical protein